MSKFLIAASLLFAFSTSATAADGRFAQPPPATKLAVNDGAPAPHADIMQVAPRRVRVLDRASVRAALAQARANSLASFRLYQQKGVFPSNTYKPGKLNVWLDEDGNFCAAATIIKLSGQDDLVNKIAEQNNFIRLADVKQGPLMSWILTSGLTQDEIAAIQEPFMDVSDREPSQPMLVDAKLRQAEDARLRAKYRRVEQQIVKNASKSLDLATDRLMKNPALAWSLDVQSLEG
jgi:hypothetical protein